jgi:hypothetical protein
MLLLLLVEGEIMKRLRRILAVPVLLILVGGSILLTSSPARADQSQTSGTRAPSHDAMVRYAIEQTQLLFAGLDAKTTNLSPRTCLDSNGNGEGVTYLPVNWGTTGATIACHIDNGQPLVLDFGGSVAWEDPPSCQGAFAKETLVSHLPPPSNVTSTATVDTKMFTADMITTPVFTASVSKSYTKPTCLTTSNKLISFYAESELLGHAGRLAVAYSGKKAFIAPLSKGTHVIVLKWSNSDKVNGGPDHTLTYNLTVG